MTSPAPAPAEDPARLPYAHGQPPATGVIRCRPEDFVVREQLGFAPDEDGQHLLVRVRKRQANTHYVARRLAVLAGVGPAAVGWAGRKDRHAVAEQWFSLDLAGREAPALAALAASEPEFDVLAVHRHRRKLRIGALAGNQFEITVRELMGEPAALAARLAQLAAGVPNYFGPQRFGRGGANLQSDRLPRGREPRAMVLSAARAAIFNAVLAARVRDGSWQRLLPGDLAQLSGSESWFVVTPAEDPAALAERLAAGDLAPSGPLWGESGSPAGGAVGELEQAVAASLPRALGLIGQGRMKPARRPLILRPQALDWSLAADTLCVSFTLPAGGYATSLLREALGVVDRAAERVSDSASGAAAG